MNPTAPNPKSGRLVTNWLAFCLLILTPVIGFAQAAATGMLQGRVYNPVSKAYVANAEVKLEGTTMATFTTDDGSFQFNNVPAGAVMLTVDYTGYDTIRESIMVTAGQQTVKEINL